MPMLEDDPNGVPRRIRILLSVARFIYSEARGLFIAGTGEDEQGEEIQNVVSEIETIPSDLDGYRWANATARFLRYLINVLAHALQEQHQLELETMSDITNMFNEENDEI